MAEDAEKGGNPGFILRQAQDEGSTNRMRMSDFKGLDLMVSLSKDELVEPWAASFFSSLPDQAALHQVLTGGSAQHDRRLPFLLADRYPPRF